MLSKICFFKLGEMDDSGNPTEDLLAFINVVSSGWNGSLLTAYGQRHRRHAGAEAEVRSKSEPVC